MKKQIENLTIEDLSRYPVWDYFEDKKGNIIASPVRHLPVNSLRGRLVGCQVTLANGQKQWADLSNIELNNEVATCHFLTLSITRDGKWFYLARYFDADYNQRGPQALSHFLGLPAYEIFPIYYDFSAHVTGAKIPTSGTIPENPLAKLSTDEIIRLSLE